MTMNRCAESVVFGGRGDQMGGYLFWSVLQLMGDLAVNLTSPGTAVEELS